MCGRAGEEVSEIFKWEEKKLLIMEGFVYLAKQRHLILKVMVIHMGA